jgi:hypothetical protein
MEGERGPVFLPPASARIKFDPERSPIDSDADRAPSGRMYIAGGSPRIAVCSSSQRFVQKMEKHSHVAIKDGTNR